MASEIRWSGSLSLTRSSDVDTLVASGTDDINSGRVHATDYTVGTVEEQLDVEDVTGIHWAFFKNMDSTNYVEIGSATTVYCMLLRAGESSGPIKWNETAVVFAKANTSNVILRTLLIYAPAS